MALNKEIWLNTIQENFYPDDSFASKSVDDSSFVTNKTVHIPNAGKPSGVEVNRKEKPAKISERTDQDLTYDIDELTSNPIYIPNVDTVELSYDKRQSVIANDRQELQRVANQNLLYRWAKGAGLIKTTGAAADVHTSDGATGQRKKFSKAEVMAATIRFNKDNVPALGRHMLLDAVMYAELLDDLTDKELSAFLNSANAQEGIIGRLYGFSFMQRSEVLRVDGKNAILPWTEADAADESAAALAWQEGCVSRAIGDVKMFQQMDDPTYYGDIYSFLVRTGGSMRRYDKKGVLLIAEDKVTA